MTRFGVKEGATEWLDSEPLGPGRERTFQVTFLEPGVEAYVFTFG